MKDDAVSVNATNERERSEFTHAKMPPESEIGDTFLLRTDGVSDWSVLSNIGPILTLAFLLKYVEEFSAVCVPPPIIHNCISPVCIACDIACPTLKHGTSSHPHPLGTSDPSTPPSTFRGAAYTHGASTAEGGKRKWNRDTPHTARADSITQYRGSSSSIYLSIVPVQPDDVNRVVPSIQ